MKKWFLLALLGASTHTFAIELCHYPEIKVAALMGKQLHFIVDLLKCTASNTTSLQLMDGKAVAVYSPNELAVLSDHIATSLTYFTLVKSEDPAHPLTPVYEFTRYTLTPDDNMNLAIYFLDANHNIIPGNLTFNCKIGDAAKVSVS